MNSWTVPVSNASGFQFGMVSSSSQNSQKPEKKPFTFGAVTTSSQSAAGSFTGTFQRHRKGFHKGSERAPQKEYYSYIQYIYENLAETVIVIWPFRLCSNCSCNSFGVKKEPFVIETHTAKEGGCWELILQQSVWSIYFLLQLPKISLGLIVLGLDPLNLLCLLLVGLLQVLGPVPHLWITLPVQTCSGVSRIRRPSSAKATYSRTPLEQRLMPCQRSVPGPAAVQHLVDLCQPLDQIVNPMLTIQVGNLMFYLKIVKLQASQTKIEVGQSKTFDTVQYKISLIQINIWDSSSIRCQGVIETVIHLPRWMWEMFP